ncbi:hypothetical protein OESDEN_22911 [Oesophagostomum dentatum]|uniref:Peptidase aspartic putative domain-containing protein n=1 Tax=Oesophagostomum dentatum TaxID=61180 RepID=A0A0B1RXR0_OESDE|nr:hypothetical protein OESDEN_22911 [Oesophagostomum dentatum]
MDSNTKALIKVDVLIDTEAEISFIDSALVQTLNIPVLGKKLPLILLGCDQLWSFIDCNKPAIPLPSGLYLLSTRLGNLISGQESHNSPQVVVVSQEKDELKYWDEQ